MKAETTATKPAEKRVVKSYKVKPSVYKKAKAKTKKEKTTVANLLEDYLYDYISE